MKMPRTDRLDLGGAKIEYSSVCVAPIERVNTLSLDSMGYPLEHYFGAPRHSLFLFVNFRNKLNIF